MRELHLARPDDCSDPHLNAVMDNICNIASQDAKVYRTYVKGYARDYVVVTTSKDIYLYLGLMQSDPQASLCILLEEEFADDKEHEVLLLNSLRNSKILVTMPLRTISGGIFQFSPA